MTITGEQGEFVFFGLGEDGGYLFTCSLIAPGIDCSEMDDAAARMMGN